MVFTVLGAVAELERRLIVERVKAGSRNARGKGKQSESAACNRERAQDCRAAQNRFLMVGNRPSNGLDERNSPENLLRAEGMSQLAQKRLT